MKDIRLNEAVAFTCASTTDAHHVAVSPRLPAIHGQIYPVCHNHVIGSSPQYRLAAKLCGNCRYGVDKISVNKAVLLRLRQGGHGCVSFAKALQVFIPLCGSAFHPLTEILLAGIGRGDGKWGKQADNCTVNEIDTVVRPQLQRTVYHVVQYGLDRIWADWSIRLGCKYIADMRKAE